MAKLQTNNTVEGKNGAETSADYMPNNRVAIKRSAFNASLVAETAQVLGYSKRYVYYVLLGNRESQAVMNCYMTLLEGRNTLLNEVKKLVPFE